MRYMRDSERISCAALESSCSTATSGSTVTSTNSTASGEPPFGSPAGGEAGALALCQQQLVSVTSDDAEREHIGVTQNYVVIERTTRVAAMKLCRPPGVRTDRRITRRG